MSCFENTVLEENCFEQFLELFHRDMEVRMLIIYSFSDSFEEMNAYNTEFFDGMYEFEQLWNFDCEGMSYDIKSTIQKYRERVK